MLPKLGWMHVVLHRSVMSAVGQLV